MLFRSYKTNINTLIGNIKEELPRLLTDNQEEIQINAFLDEYIYGTKDHNEYLDKLGASHLLGLRVKSGYGYVPGLKRR